MVRCGAPWVLCFEWNHSAAENMLLEDVRSKNFRMIGLGCFKMCGAAPICAIFLVAVTPPVRSSRLPRGMQGLRHSMRQKVSKGNSHNDFMKDVVDAAEVESMAYLVENPDCGWWWGQRRWQRWRSPTSHAVFCLCFCRFGTGWRKATRVATNNDVQIQVAPSTSARTTPTKANPMDVGGAALPAGP